MDGGGIGEFSTSLSLGLLGASVGEGSGGGSSDGGFWGF